MIIADDQQSFLMETTPFILKENLSKLIHSLKTKRLESTTSIKLELRLT